MVIIIRQPQTVSNLLCELFHYYTPQTGAWGFPSELWPWQFRDASVTEETLNRYFTSTGHLRITSHLLDRLLGAVMELWDVSEAEVISALEARCDSPIRFIETHRWNTMLSSVELLHQELGGDVDTGRVMENVYLCLRAQTLQARILRKFGISPHLVHFEEFVQDVPANFAKLCGAIGVPCAPVADIEVRWDTRENYPQPQMEAWMDATLVELENRLGRQHE